MTNPAGAPTLTLTADKAVYNVGDPIEITATYADDEGSLVTLTISGTATDAAGNTASATAEVQVSTPATAQPMDVTVTDSFGDAYAQVSNDGTGTAVFSSTVGSPPAAA
jgi:hypothetical protein